MDTVEKVQTELESCLNSINAAGIDKLDSQHIEKLCSISTAADSLGMVQGKKLIENLSDVLRAFTEGNAIGDSVKLRLTALEFYLQNTKGATTEEL